jgi:hypothetical protein
MEQRISLSLCSGPEIATTVDVPEHTGLSVTGLMKFEASGTVRHSPPSGKRTSTVGLDGGVRAGLIERRWIIYSQVGNVNSDIMLVDHFR